MVNIDMAMASDTRLILFLFRKGQWLQKNKSNIFLLPMYILIKIIYKFLEIIYGFSIPFQTKIGSNICFKHGLYGVFISSHAVIGNNVIIMHQVTIGSNYTSDKEITAPIVGDNVFIGPGAKIIGKVSIEDYSKVGANALIVDEYCPKGIYVSPKAKKI